MKIAVLLSSMNGGGTERMRLNLIDEWLKLGIEVDLVVGKFSGELCGLVPDSVRVFEIAPKGPLTLPIGLIRYLKENSPDFLLSAGNDINAIGLLLKKLKIIRCPLAISFHIQISKYIEILTGKNKLREMLANYLISKTILSADAIIAVSEGIKRDLLAAYRLHDEAISVIYNPTITDTTFDKISEPISESPLKKNAPWIIFAGRFVHQKGLDVLLSAFDKIKNKTNAELILLGKGPLEKEIKEFVSSNKLENRIHIVPYDDNPYRWIKLSNVFVLPSRNEGLPNVLIEAMACGTQIIATDCESGPREILNDGDLGMLVPVDDVAELSEAILRFLNDEYCVPPNKLIERANSFQATLSAAEYLRVLDAAKENK